MISVKLYSVNRRLHRADVCKKGRLRIDQPTPALGDWANVSCPSLLSKKGPNCLAPALYAIRCLLSAELYMSCTIY